MKPYQSEIKYSHLEDLRRLSIVGSTGTPDDPRTAFERQVQSDLAAARQAHLNDELGIAIRGYQQLQARILQTANPSLPVTIVNHPSWQVLYLSETVDSFVAMAAESVSRLRPSVAPDPEPDADGLFWPLDIPAKSLLARPELVTAGTVSTFDTVHQILVGAESSVSSGDFATAKARYAQAIDVAGEVSPELSGYLLQDLALVQERGGDAGSAQASLKTAQERFVKAGSADGQVSAAAALSGLLTRQGDTAGAQKALTQATELSRQLGVFTIDLAGLQNAAPRVSIAAPLSKAAVMSLRAPIAQAATPALQALAYVADKRTIDTLRVVGADTGVVNVALNGDKTASLKNLYQTMATTADISLLHIQAFPPTMFVAYLPYVYFYVIPMSLGDCYQAAGDYASAETSYQAALRYPYLNAAVETVQIWTRLAQTYLAWGDTLYRAEADGDATAMYARILQADGTIPAGSPLYADAKFADVRARATTIAAAADPTTVDDNAAIALPLARARMRLTQLGAGLNFLGFASDFLPPFSFESLQTSARYLAEHAATMEQAYVQFKSQAENEQFRADQMAQQVDLAAASVRLEQDGVAQATAGVNVAQRSLDYASTQLSNAQQASAEFAGVRWELEELAQLDAWAQASAVDHDDEVKLSISGYDSFSADHENRNTVLQRLAAQRASLTDTLEQDRLDREVAAAQSYRGVAQAQVAQAQAGVKVAQQRVVVAQLQQKQAQDNRDFLDLREFSARHWYDMARVMKGLAGDYLDMATSVAWLMQRAYAAETARDLHKIGLDYRNAGAGDVLGSDVLLRDIDFFTVDFLTSTRSKKAPIKVSFSMADTYPSALRALRQTGTAAFATTLDQFDRLYPGFYLHKVRDVAVQFVGVSGAGGVHGTLRNIGVSQFRAADGTEQQLVYPADVLPLSLYDLRQDSLVLRADPSQLRLFENNGAATMWRLDLPLGTNDVDLAGLLDVTFTITFDAFFDASLETSVKAALPTTGTAAKSTSMRLQAPDELFFLRSQGSGVLRVSAADFPRTQKDLVRSSFILRLSGDPGAVANRQVRLTPASTGTSLTLTTDADGLVQPAGLTGGPAADDFTVAIDGDLLGLTDVSVYQDYSFTWR